MKVKLIFLLLLSFSLGFSQEITFSYSGKWGKHLLYGVAVCSDGDGEAMTVPGGQVWQEAQLRGVAPLTYSQIQSYLAEREKWGFGKVAKTLTLIGAGATTALQGTDVLGERWKSGIRYIAPGVGFLVLVLDATASYQGKLVLPPDYLPLSVPVPAGGCWIGSLIARGD